ncbi:MAG: hypothetical protein QG598_1718, partial [Bacillota bacterium]|nr:hypothetical protein [Bacillota bacterium]
YGIILSKPFLNTKYTTYEKELIDEKYNRSQ